MRRSNRNARQGQQRAPAGAGAWRGWESGPLIAGNAHARKNAPRRRKRGRRNALEKSESKRIERRNGSSNGLRKVVARVRPNQSVTITIALTPQLGQAMIGIVIVRGA